jgi:hypothetical protein
MVVRSRRNDTFQQPNTFMNPNTTFFNTSFTNNCVDLAPIQITKSSKCLQPSNIQDPTVIIAAFVAVSRDLAHNSPNPICISPTSNLLGNMSFLYTGGQLTTFYNNSQCSKNHALKTVTLDIGVYQPWWHASCEKDFPFDGMSLYAFPVKCNLTSDPLDYMHPNSSLINWDTSSSTRTNDSKELNTFLFAIRAIITILFNFL